MSLSFLGAVLDAAIVRTTRDERPTRETVRVLREALQRVCTAVFGTQAAREPVWAYLGGGSYSVVVACRDRALRIMPALDVMELDAARADDLSATSADSYALLLHSILATRAAAASGGTVRVHRTGVVVVPIGRGEIGHAQPDFLAAAAHGGDVQAVLRALGATSRGGRISVAATAFGYVVMDIACNTADRILRFVADRATAMIRDGDDRVEKRVAVWVDAVVSGSLAAALRLAAGTPAVFQNDFSISNVVYVEYAGRHTSILKAPPRESDFRVIDMDFAVVAERVELDVAAAPETPGFALSREARFALAAPPITLAPQPGVLNPILMPKRTTRAGRRARLGPSHACFEEHVATRPAAYASPLADMAAFFLLQVCDMMPETSGGAMVARRAAAILAHATSADAVRARRQQQ